MYVAQPAQTRHLKRNTYRYKEGGRPIGTAALHLYFVLTDFFRPSHYLF